MNTRSPANAGTLDQEFGTNGVVSISVPGYHKPFITNVSIGPDQKIYFAGNIGLAWSSDAYFLGRLNDDGTADTTFGTKGQSIGQVPGAGMLMVGSLAFQPDGKIVLLGRASSDDYYNAPFLTRYHADGTLDTRFGIDGICLLDIALSPPAGMNATDAKPLAQPRKWASRTSNSASQAQGVVVLPDGKILVFKHHTFTLRHSHGLIIRLTQEGSLDTEFNQIGYIGVIHPDYLHHATVLRNIMVQADGKYLGCGNVIGDGQPPAAMFVRYNTNGLPDPTFGGSNGFVTVPSATPDGIERMLQQPNQRILGVGNTYFWPYKGLMISLEHDGSPNIQFNRGEPFYTELVPDGVTAWEAAALQKNGRIVVAGAVQLDGETDIVVARFIDAQLDPDFNEGQGWVRTTLASEEQYATGLTLQEDGKMVVSAATPTQAVILRYHA